MVRKLSSLLAGIFLFLVYSSSVQAYFGTVPVELTVPNTTLTMSGKASPNALVTIKVAGSTVATVSADSFGNFSSTSIVTSGIKQVLVSYTDSKGLASSVYTKSLSFQSQQDTTDNVYLAPTISRTNSGDIESGSLIQIRGFSVPNTNIALKVDYGKFESSTTTDASGRYEFLIDSAQIGVGEHRASVTAQSSIENSLVSKEVLFNIVSTDSPSAPDIVVSPDILPPPIPVSPEDGAVIDSDTVIISGESVPNAQINIYEDNRLISTIQADENGKWSFEYRATYTPVTLTFEACLDGRCSVFSRTITLNFATLARCNSEFALEEYRYWGIPAGEVIELVVESITSDGVVETDWDDGSREMFDVGADVNNSFAKSYSAKGTYNGTITFVNDNCEIKRYFIVSVIESESDNNRWLWLAIIVLLAVLLYDLSRREKN